MSENLRDREILWSTNVGSHMWKMNTPESDFDIFEVYIASTEKILDGTANTNSYCTQDGINDYAGHEIGQCIDMLCKGNINFIYGIMSPLTIKESPYLTKLQNIYKNNMSKNCYHSINGLATHNYKKYIKDGKGFTWKRIAMQLRTLNFGINLLRNHEIKFEPVVKNEITNVDIKEGIEALEDAYKNSTLPERSDEKEYRNYLFSIRMDELNKICHSDV